MISPAPSLGAKAKAAAETMHKHLERLLPDPAKVALQGWLAARESAPEDWKRLLLSSDTAPQWFLKDPGGPFASLISGALDQAPSSAEIEAMMGAAATDAPDFQVLKRRLREARNQLMSGIIWREATNRGSFAQTVATVSEMADQALIAALGRLEEWARLTWGTPDTDNPGLLVLGMGKLGGRELNLSSDIDLIFVYEKDGQCLPPESGPPTPLGPVNTRRLTHREYYTRVGQRLSQALDDVTADGFVFRVDMRLRPFGSAGALAISLTSLEAYYEEHGRDWERYALLKARPMAGPEAVGLQAVALIHSFAYRRYADFSVLSSLRDMHRAIATKARRQGKGGRDNIKLGDGGIREMEFIVQALQLIHGGRQRKLRSPSFLGGLAAIREAGLLSDAETGGLEKAYIFLRNLEHRMQGLGDHQTQDWPKRKKQQERLAWSLGYPNPGTLRADCERHQTQISRLFAALSGEDTDQNDAGSALWLAILDQQDPVSEDLRIHAPSLASCDQLLTNLMEKRLQLPVIAARRLDSVMPKLLDAVLRMANPERSLRRTMPIIGNILRRSVYLSMLDENPPMLIRLVSLCSASDWIGTVIARKPMLMDTLLDDQRLARIPSRTELLTETTAGPGAASGSDLEAAISGLGELKSSHELRSAILDLTNTFPLEKISDYLSVIAEVILERALAICWQHLIAQEAFPPGIGAEPQMAIIAYGKLGGIELGYGSDLDLIFLYDSGAPGEGDQEAASAAGQPALTRAIYHKLARRLLHALSTPTVTGKLYDIDTRLRPSGRSGSMVSSMTAMTSYQRTNAWTWEHQALVRARPVAGSPRVGSEFQKLRREILTLPRNRAELRKAVAEMRGKMHSGRKRAARLPIEAIRTQNQAVLDGEAALDVKNCAGGIIDIEFLAQYFTLGWASEFPDLADHTDNLRIFDVARARGILSPQDTKTLQAAYLKLRGDWHRSILNSSHRTRDPGLLELRLQTTLLWEQLIGAPKPEGAS